MGKTLTKLNWVRTQDGFASSEDTDDGVPRFTVIRSEDPNRTRKPWELRPMEFGVSSWHETVHEAKFAAERLA